MALAAVAAIVLSRSLTLPWWASGALTAGTVYSVDRLSRWIGGVEESTDEGGPARYSTAKVIRELLIAELPVLIMGIGYIWILIRPPSVPNGLIGIGLVLTGAGVVSRWVD